MQTFDWDSISVRVHGKRRFLISGEFHYFRVPKNMWRLRLRQLKDAGGNAAATYVPWLIHEPKEGVFTFEGEPWLDLEAFLDICSEEGLLVIARPGPYQYSELQFAGLPRWLVEGHPEILATDLAGKPRSFFSVSYLHPFFLERAKRWFDHVCPILARHTMSRGGPIALVQFDNELTGIHEWFGGWDWNRETIGLGRIDGRYSRYLQSRYSDIRELNTAYGTSFPSFSDVLPLEGRDRTTDAERRRVRDSMLFYYGSIAEYAGILTGWMRERDIDTPFCHNSANPGMNAHFRETMDRAATPILLGSDHYYNLDQQWEQNNPTPQYAVKCFISLEMLQLWNCPPVVWEMPGGSFSEWPPITPTDFRAAHWLHLAFGVKGVNHYIFTGGPNPPGVGTTGDVYDYGAPIGPEGEIRPTYEVMRELNRFLTDHPWLVEASLEADFQIGIDWNQSRDGAYFNNRGEHTFTPADAWNLLRKGIVTSALCGSRIPCGANLSSDTLLNRTALPLWISASVCMERSIQERLVRFVEKGGRVIFSPIIPNLDHDLRPCTVLLDYLGVPPPLRNEQPGPRLSAGSLRNIHINQQLFRCPLPRGAEEIAVEERSGASAGWALQKGKGLALWLGLQWFHSQRAHSDLIKQFLARSGAPPPSAVCDNPNVWAIIRGNGQNRMVFLMNLFTEPMEAGLKVRMLDNTELKMGRFNLSGMEVRAIPLP